MRVQCILFFILNNIMIFMFTSWFTSHKNILFHWEKIIMLIYLFANDGKYDHNNIMENNLNFWYGPLSCI